MNDDAIAEYLKRPPEEVRLAEMYPQLPQPIPFPDATAFSVWDEENDREYDEDDPPTHPPRYTVCFDIPQGSGFVSTDFAVTGHHHRIVAEYDVAQERQMDAEEACAKARWLKPPAPPPRPPEPEDVPPGGDLTPRQEEFCRNYAVQPIAIRAAVLAGYAESNADSYGPRLLKNPLVLDRIAALRSAKGIHYTLDRDTMHDKLEAVFFDALGERNHAAAVAALRLQALLGGMALRPHGAGAAGRNSGKAGVGAAEMPGKAGVSPRQKPGKARTQRRKKPGEARKSP
jgi:hypothetical protein